MKLIISYLFASLLLLNSCSSSLSDKSREEVLQIVASNMDEQIECWNKGDIPCYMKHYWHSDSLQFIGKKGITFGWQRTLDNYLESYDDTISMGQLSFENKTLRMLDDNTVQVIGKWKLTRDKSVGDLEGHYSLIWQNKEGQWVIITDHSS